MSIAETLTGKMLTWDQAVDLLSEHEPVSSVHFTADDSTTNELELEPGFNAGLKQRKGTDLLDATLSVGGDQYQLTKDALLALTTSFGITRDYVAKTPAKLLVPHANYWLKKSGREYRLITSDDVKEDGTAQGLAFAKSASIVPFSNSKIMESIGKVLEEREIDLDEVRVDHKIHHDLLRTAVRIVVPGDQVEIESARSSADKPDTWSTGLQFINSLTGFESTSLHGYLFSWWCLNGAISTHAESSRYNRRQQGQAELELAEWVTGSTKNVLDDIGHELDAVAELPKVSLEDELNFTLTDIFTQEKVPTDARESILALLLESGDTSAYGVMQAITAAANDPKTSDHERERLMRVGGNMTSAFSHRCSKCHRLALA